MVSRKAHRQKPDEYRKRQITHNDEWIGYRLMIRDQKRPSIKLPDITRQRTMRTEKNPEWKIQDEIRSQLDKKNDPVTHLFVNLIPYHAARAFEWIISCLIIQHPRANGKEAPVALGAQGSTSNTALLAGFEPHLKPHTAVQARSIQTQFQHKIDHVSD